MNTTFNILRLLEIARIHDVRIMIYYHEGVAGNSYVLTFQKGYYQHCEWVSELDIIHARDSEEFLKLIFEKSIHELEEACKNDQT